MRMLVTGGGGFLGSHLARRLLKRGDQVAVLGRGEYPNLDSGIEAIQADIRDPGAVNKALKDRDVVFHAAALPGIWGDRDEFYSINVEGTRNVIEACWENSVKKMVFTSSPSVVFDRSDMENVDESVAYPKSYLCSYPETKAIAERLVTHANGVNDRGRRGIAG